MSHSLLINEPPLVLLPDLARIVGVESALFIHQVHCLLNPNNDPHFHDDRYWIDTRSEQWGEHFPFWKDATIRRIIGRLASSGILEVDSRPGFNRSSYYTINYDALDRLFIELNSAQPPLPEILLEHSDISLSTSHH